MNAEKAGLDHGRGAVAEGIGRKLREVGVDLKAPELPGGTWIAESVMDVSTLREMLGQNF